MDPGLSGGNQQGAAQTGAGGQGTAAAGAAPQGGVPFGQPWQQTQTGQQTQPSQPGQQAQPGQSGQQAQPGQPGQQAQPGWQTQATQGWDSAKQTGQAAASAAAAFVKNAGQKKRSNKFYIGIAAVVVVLIALMALIPTLTKEKIDLKDYINVYVEGANGYGTVNAEADIEGLEDKLYQITGSMEPIAMYEDSIGYPVTDVYDSLKNGDKVEVTWEMPEGLAKVCKVKFKNESFTYEVADLPEVQEVDLFEGATMYYEGMAPYGTCYFEWDNEYDLSYELSQTENLSNGDVVKVTVMLDDGSPVEDLEAYLAQSYGVKAASFTKEFVVEGLSSYVTELSQINQEGIDAMDQQLRDALTAETANWNKESKITDIELLGEYLLTPKPSQYGDANQVYLVYKMHYKNTGDDPIELDYYYFGKFFNVSVDESGNLNVDLSNYYLCSDDFQLPIDGYWWLNGYETLDDLYRTQVSAQADIYQAESNIE